jgi:hypothetical protein
MHLEMHVEIHSFKLNSYLNYSIIKMNILYVAIKFYHQENTFELIVYFLG